MTQILTQCNPDLHLSDVDLLLLEKKVILDVQLQVLNFQALLVDF